LLDLPIFRPRFPDRIPIPSRSSRLAIPQFSSLSRLQSVAMEIRLPCGSGGAGFLFTAKDTRRIVTRKWLILGPFLPGFACALTQMNLF
jgi:hypothetical protein